MFLYNYEFSFFWNRFSPAVCHRAEGDDDFVLFAAVLLFNGKKKKTFKQGHVFHAHDSDRSKFTSWDVRWRCCLLLLRYDVEMQKNTAIAVSLFFNHLGCLFFFFQLSVLKTWAPFEGRKTLVCKPKINISQLTLLSTDRFTQTETQHGPKKKKTMCLLTLFFSSITNDSEQGGWESKPKNQSLPFTGLFHIKSRWRRKPVCWRYAVAHPVSKSFFYSVRRFSTLPFQ